MKSMIVALALLIPMLASGSQVSPCVAETVQALNGSTCSVGAITFNFGAASIATGQSPISLSAVTFTPGGTFADPSFTLSGPITTSTPSQSPFYASEFFELVYTASVNQTGPYSEIVTQLESSYSPSDIDDQFSYQDGIGSGFALYANCLGPEDICNSFAASDNGVLLDGSQLILNGSSPSPDFTSVYTGDSFEGYSYFNLWTNEAVTAAYLYSGTSSFTVTTATPEPATMILIAIGLLGLKISRHNS